jgi:hypothetical protein
LFTGTEVDGFYAPDIASGALAKTWTRDNLMQFPGPRRNGAACSVRCRMSCATACPI